jgi:hypothetical protein
MRHTVFDVGIAEHVHECARGDRALRQQRVALKLFLGGDGCIFGKKRRVTDEPRFHPFLRL